MKKTVRRKSTHPHNLQWIIYGVGAALLILGIVIGSSWQKKEDIPIPQQVSHGGKAKLLYVQTAGSGSLISLSSEQGAYGLLLTNITPRTLLFNDLPRRQVGSMNLDTFLQKTWDPATGDSFLKDPPHAVLITHDTTEGHEEAVELILSKPQYDAEAGTLIYRAKILSDTDQETLGALNDKDTTVFPEQFENPVLFIDDFSFSNKN